MMDTFIRFLFPGTPLSSGGGEVTLGHEGIAWSTAGWLFALIAVAVISSYLYFARRSPRYARVGLSILRLIVVAILLLLLVRPILIIPQKETTRRPLLVLLDTSRSMTLTDKRDTAEDRARAALAAGTIDPHAGLPQPVPGVPLQPSRADLLTSLAANPRLALWPRLHSRADLHFYGFGSKISDLGALKPAADTDPLTPEESAAFFRNISYEGERTALGDSLRELLGKTADQVAGVLVISDGANNAGVSPMEVARELRAEEVPLFLYGVGVSAPPDVSVTEIVAPDRGIVKERVNLVVRFRSQGLTGVSSTLRLSVGEKVLAEERVDFRSDGEQEWRFSYIPETGGQMEITAAIDPLPQESVRNNNARSTQIRIRDEKINVLFIQREPNWDFQYLLAFLQRDRRVNVKCAMVKGDPGLTAFENSPFLPALPSDRPGLLGYDVIILGDVAPEDLGNTRQGLIREWVDQLGGGLVLLSGPRLNATSYRGSPMEPLFAVTAGKIVPSGTITAGFPLSLTAAGQASAFLRLSGDARTTAAAWAGFPGVRWMTPSGPPRPGAQVLLTGPASALAGDPLPTALALQRYGAGQALYVGIGETHLWRARAGEKFYAQIWLQILQNLSIRRDVGATAYSHLKIERTEYLPGERIRITAWALNPDFTPVTTPEISGNLLSGEKSASQVPFQLSALPGRPGEFAAEMSAPAEGSYTVSLASDAEAAVSFRVKSPAIEMGDISLRERTLGAMATAAGGRFLREEDLDQLPDLITARNAPVITHQKVPLTLAPTLLAIMILAACAEWLWRRKIDLK